MIPSYVFSAPGSGIPDVHVLRGTGIPKVESGYANWEVVDRPKRKGATRYIGSDPVRMSVPILFDGWKDDRDQETPINNLLRMKQEVGGEPPAVRLTGGAPRRGMRWVIESIDWGDNVIYDTNQSGTAVRYRQDATVHLLEKVDVTAIALGSRPPGNTRGTTKLGGKHAHHVVKKGETLPSIAVSEYGDRSKWQEIAKANNIRDPRDIKVGQSLRLP